MSTTAIAPADPQHSIDVLRDAARKAAGAAIGFVQLQTLAQAREFAEILCKTDFVPKDYVGKPGNAIVAMQMGLEIGLPPLQAIQSIAVVNGRPALWGDGLRALILSAPDLTDIDEKDDGETATCSITRGNRSPVVRTFSMADAKLAGLAGGNVWGKYPKRMRQNRAFALAARDAYADRLRGISSAEEQHDADNDAPPTPREPQRIKDVTPPKAETTAPTATEPAPATAAAPAGNGNGSNGDPVTQRVAGIAFTDTTQFVAAAGSKREFWTVKTAAGEFFIADEALAKEVDTCAGTDHTFTLAFKLAKRANGQVVKQLLQLDVEEGGAQ